jgi:hypothetical protein
MKKPNAELEIPREWRIATIVTKAPAKPWSLVRTMLEYMLAQDVLGKGAPPPSQSPQKVSGQYMARRTRRMAAPFALVSLYTREIRTRTKWLTNG